MSREQFLQVFDNLPTKRKQVLLGILRGDPREKIMADVGVTADALNQHKRQLYANFKIQIFQNDADDPRSGERKLHLLVALCAKYKPDLITPNANLVFLSNPEASPSPNFPSYNPQTWVGREALVNELVPQLQEQTRLLWITGISGIGKTALGECLASQVWQRDPSFQWVYLDVSEVQSTDFASVAAYLLEAKLGDRELAPQERNNPEQVAKRLIQKLKSHSYWIQLDSLERLLNSEQSTEFADPYWATFLQRCLTESNFISRFVLTSQALPKSLAEFSESYSNHWHEVTLRGLSANEHQNEPLEFFSKNSITVDESNQALLDRIGQIYEGHPLVLRVIAREIAAAPFNGNVEAYWQRYSNEFEQVARDLQTERVNLALYNQALQQKVRQRVEISLKRLPADAFDLLCRSSVYRRPVPESFWLSMISDLSPEQQQEAYCVLGDRALIEREGIHQGQFLICQHNLIRDTAYDLLRQIPHSWPFAEQRAANLWLTDYRFASDAENLEKVRGYLEAFHHYCEIEKWKTARIISQTILDTPIPKRLCEQLGVWGYYQEQLLLYKKLLKIAQKTHNRKDESAALGSLGGVYSNLSNYHQAKEYDEQDLKISRELKDRTAECTALGNLGTDYQYLRNYSKAIKCYIEQREIAQEIGDLEQESRVLNNLGTCYYDSGDYCKAIECYKERLKIIKKNPDPYAKANILGNLGNTWCALGHYEEAIQHHGQSLSISRKIGYRLGEAQDLVNLGVAQTKYGLYGEALGSIQDGLKTFKEIGNRSGEAKAFSYLAELYQAQGEIVTARQYCQQALELAIELGLPLKEECEVLLQTLGESNAS